MSKLSSLNFVVGLLCAGVMTTQSFAADEGSRGAIPDFSSVDLPWLSPSSDFIPPAVGPGPITYDKAHPRMARNPNNRGDAVDAPMHLADLNNPNLKPWVVERLKKANEELVARGIRYASRASCRPAGVPQFLKNAGGFEPIYFIQTPNEVVMIHQADNQVRHIYMNVGHSEHPVPSWYGESVGHYEGDELVVDTIGFNDRTFVDDNYHVPHTTQLHVIERFKLIEDGKILQATVTIEDPDSFNAPWSGIVRYRHPASPDRLEEEPCADQNVGEVGFHSRLFDVPTAAKPDF